MRLVQADNWSTNKTQHLHARKYMYSFSNIIKLLVLYKKNVNIKFTINKANKTSILSYITITLLGNFALKMTDLIFANN